MTEKKAMIFVLIGAVVFLSAAWAFELVVLKAIYKPEEIEFCKTFSSGNSSVRDYFGAIRSIKLGLRGGGKSVSSAEGISGSCILRIKGSKQNGTVKIRWRKSDGKINASEISMRVGLAGTRILWPESKATSPDYVLPSYVWDGIILLMMAPLAFFFYLDTKREGKLVKFFFPFVTQSESIRSIMKNLFLVAAFGEVVCSILCFLNICTLF